VYRPRENGPRENGPREFRPRENGPREFRPREDRFGENRPRSNRPPEGGPRDSAPRGSLPGPPDTITAAQMDPDARAQLYSLPNDLADTVARYLVAAGMAEDPEQGYEYAQAAKRLAARVGVVREATGIAAYRAGRWAEALAELRAARRMTGRDDYLPMMADSERALGRLDRALAVIHEADTSTLDRAMQIELRIVESGIRRDQGLADAAVIALQVPELTRGRLRPWSARLFYAYAEALLAAGRTEEARDAFARAVGADPDGETDAADRLDELDGVEFEDLADDDADDDDAGADADEPEDVTNDPV
jgi:tetratricopeptide (TPR) repeat protein